MEYKQTVFKLLYRNTKLDVNKCSYVYMTARGRSGGFGRQLRAGSFGRAGCPDLTIHLPKLSSPYEVYHAVYYTTVGIVQ